MVLRFPDCEILVMARAPEPGRAKTRLIPALGEAGAAELHRLLVQRLLDELVPAQLAPVTLCCTPDLEHPFFRHCQHHYGIGLLQQQGEDLGERLHHALATALTRSRHAVVIGCDIPQLDVEDLTGACHALQWGEQAVVSPTEDGGYALLGLSQPEPRLFEGIAWGSAQVMTQSRERLEQLGWCWCELRQQWDLDTPAELPRLRALRLSAQIDQLLSAIEP